MFIDFSIWEMWGAFRHGECLIVPSYQETRDPSLFYELVLKHKVTVLNQTPSAFKVFVQEEQTHCFDVILIRYYHKSLARQMEQCVIKINS